MDEDTRAAMQTALGHDFSSVRIHTDELAARSTRDLAAQAYTVGHHVVFGSSRYRPQTPEGRRLLAHELVHVAQQGSAAVAAAGGLSVGDPDDPAEVEAARTAQSIEAGGGGAGGDSALGVLRPTKPALRRVLVTDPPGAVSEIVGEFNQICAPEFPLGTPASGRIESHCTAISSAGCECLCDVTSDPGRTYTVQVRSATATWSTTTLADGSTASVPIASVTPKTTSGSVVTVTDPSSSNVEFGEFDPSGRPLWAPPWRILAHELCGHARLGQTYGGGPGNRPGHDVTIDTENQIAADHGQAGRGHFSDRRQGESFYNPVGDRSRVVFHQRDGLHYEPP